MPEMRPAQGGLSQIRPLPNLSAGDGAQGRVARYHEIVVVIDMIDSSLIVAALGGNGRTRQARPWATPTRRRNTTRPPTGSGRMTPSNGTGPDGNQSEKE